MPWRDQSVATIYIKAGWHPYDRGRTSFSVGGTQCKDLPAPAVGEALMEGCVQAHPRRFCLGEMDGSHPLLSKGKMALSPTICTGGAGCLPIHLLIRSTLVPPSQVGRQAAPVFLCPEESCPHLPPPPGLLVGATLQGSLCHHHPAKLGSQCYSTAHSAQRLELDIGWMSL